MAIDPRLELARRMAAGQGGYSGGGGSTLQQEAAARFAALKNKKATQPQAQDVGGWKGVVSAALDNPIAKTALAPLMVLDYGRSAAVSGVKEIADAFDGNVQTKGDFLEFMKQTKNHIGFGDIEQFKSGNKWMDRITGFVGDVALDPLTYLTLGTGATANLGSRVGLAAEIAEKGAAKVVSKEITQQALDNIVAKAGKNGLSKLGPAERAMFDLPKSGLYFGAPFAKKGGAGILIPGTEKLGAKLSSGLGSTKNAILGSKPITKLTTTSEGLLRKAPEGLEEAFTKLATGKGRISTTQAASVISGHTKKAAVGAAFTNTWARVADGLLQDVSKDEAARVALTHALEAGDNTNSVTAAARKWYDDVREAFMNETGKTIDDIGYRDNYVPHMWNEEGRAVLAGDTQVSEDLRKIMSVSVDEVQKAGPTFERKIEAGTYKIGGKDITFNSGTIDEINNVLSREFPDLFKTGKALEDDSLKLMGSYANAMGRGVGDDAFVKRLTAMGVGEDSSTAMHLVKDAGETKAANKVLHKELVEDIKVTNASIKRAKAAAHVSMKAAVENVGNTIKQKLAVMSGRSAALKNEFDALAVKLSSDAVDFEAKMALLLDAETAARTELDAAVSHRAALEARYADEIAAVEQAGKEADKARLVAYREAKKAIADAEANVGAIQAQLDAYNTLKETAGKLNDDIKTMVEGVQFKDLPDEARKAAKTRTVAKQQSIDSASTKGAEEATQVVKLGSGMNESFGLMKKLKFDAKAVGSALRQTVDAAGAHVGEQYHVEISAIHDMIDQAASRVAPGTNEALDKATKAVAAAEDRVANLRLQLEGARANNRSASTIAKWEGRLADAERGLGVAKQEADAIGGSEVKSVLTFDETMPGAARDADFNRIPKAALEEQFNKQIQFAKNALMKKVFDETAATLGVDAATKNAVVVDNLVKSFEVAARSRTSPAGSASAVAAAQMALEESVTNARIATDFAQRLSSVTQIIEQSGRQMTAVERQAVENMVMREVLTTEREAMQEKVRQLVSSMEHYATQEGGVTTKVNLAKTKAAQAGKKRANETWDILRLYLDELFSTTREAGLREGVDAADFGIASASSREVIGRTADEAANSGFSVYTPGAAGKTSRAQQQAFAQAKRDLKQAIADILFEGDSRGARQYAESGKLDSLLNKISSGYGPESKAAWTEEFERIYAARNGSGTASTINRSNRTARWLATAAQGAEKEVELLSEKILQTDRLIQRLRPTGSGVNTLDNQATVAFFSEQAKGFRSAYDNLPRGPQRKQAKYYLDLFEGVASERATTGVPKGAPRLTAAEVLAGKVRPSGVPTINKELKAARTALVAAEQEMERIVTTGALKDAVKDVPGRATPFNKAKRYIAVIDEEIGIIKARAKGLNPEARKEALQYVRTLNNEKLRLEGLIRSAEPLEDRLVSGKVVLQQAKDNFKGLQSKAALKAEVAGKVQGLRVQRDAMMVGQDIVEAGKAGQVIQAEVAKETLRETYDATVAATRDALGTIDTARNEIDSLIPAVEELVRDTPKVGKGMLRDDVVEQIEWLSDAYAMMDEQSLVERLFNMPGDMTPDILKAGRTNTGITNPEMIAFLRSLPADPSSNTALALIYQAHKDQGVLFTLMGEKEALKAQAQMAKDGTLITVMKRVAKDGMQELADSGVFVPREVADIMTKIVELDSRTAGELMTALNKYTEIWKAVKTTSPRFHIRNAMSATFMNYVADVKTKNMVKGIEYWRLFEQDPLNWLDNIAAAERPYAKAALEDVFGSGGGQYSEIAMANSKISNKGIFKMSKEKGVQVEGYVRMGMALDSRLPVELGGKGLGFDQSVARITKFHFNYSQLSKLDRNAKAFIPFWTFMSRNLPLQIEMMWTNPRAYAMYKSFVRNVNDDQEGDIVPKYIKEIGGFKLPFGQDLYMTPDIGMNRVEQDLAQLRDPMRLGQNLNPLFKTPLEYWAGKQFYKDIPLSGDRYVPLKGAGKVLQPFGELFGAVERSSDGTPTMSQKNFYAGMQLIPGLQELERLVAPGQENYKEKQGISILNFMTGAPIAKVTQSARDSERERMKRELAARRAKKKAVNKGARG